MILCCHNYVLFVLFHIIQAEGDPASAERASETTLAGGAPIDLEKVAREQQIKNQEEVEKILAAVKAKHGEGALKEGRILTTGRDGEITTVNGLGQNSRAGTEEHNATTTSALSEPKRKGHKGKAKKRKSRRDTAETTLDDSGGETREGTQLIDGPKKKKHSRSGQADFDKVTGKVDLCLTMHFHQLLHLFYLKEQFKNGLDDWMSALGRLLAFSAWVKCIILRRGLLSHGQVI